MANQYVKTTFDNGADQGAVKSISAPGYPDVEAMLNRPYNTDAGAAHLGMPPRDSAIPDLSEPSSDLSIPDLDPYAEDIPDLEPHAAEYDNAAAGAKAKASLPKHLSVFGLDTGVPINQDVAAGLVRAGEAMTSVYRGAKQILGIDTADMQQNHEYLTQLSKDPTTQTAQLVGTVLGSLVEPVGLALPVAKVNTAWQLAKTGAVAGGFYGAVSYKDSADDTVGGRVHDALVGSALGAALTPLGGAVVNKIAGVIKTKLGQGMRASVDDVLEVLPEATPEQAKQAAALVEHLNDTLLPAATDDVRKEVNRITSGKIATPAKKVAGEAANEADINAISPEDLRNFKAVNSSSFENMDAAEWLYKNTNPLTYASVEKSAAPMYIPTKVGGGISYTPPMLTKEQFKMHRIGQAFVNDAGKIEDQKAFDAAYDGYALGAQLRGAKDAGVQMPAETRNVFAQVEAERVAIQKQEEEAGFAAINKSLSTKVQEAADDHITRAADSIKYDIPAESPNNAMFWAFRKAIAEVRPGQEGVIHPLLMARMASAGVGAAGGYAVGGEKGMVAGALLGVAGPTAAMAIIKRLGEIARVSTAAYQKEIATHTVQALEAKINEYSSVGLSPKAAYQVALDHVGLSHEEVLGHVNASGKKLRLVPVQSRNTDEFIKGNASIASVSAPSAINDFVTPVSTLLRKMSEPVFGRLRKYEFDILRKSSNMIGQAGDFTSNIKKVLSDEDYKSVWAGLLNRDFAGVEKTLASYGNPAMTEGFAATKKVLGDLNDSLKKAGHTYEGFEGYYPRIVIDKAGLLKKLSADARIATESDIYDSTRALGRSLSMEEESAIIDRHIRGLAAPRTVDQPLLSAAKQRQMDTIPPEFLPFYASPEAAINTHIKRAVIDIETRNLLGRSVAEDAGKKIDIEKSVGALMAGEIKDGSLDPTHVDYVKQLIVARLNANHASAYKGLSHARSIMYMTTLGNPISALSQVGDVFLSGYAHGAFNTIKAAAKLVIGKGEVGVKDLGLHDLHAEFTSTDAFVRGVHDTLKLSGFSAVDRLGKTVHINAALEKSKALAATDAGVAKLYEKWGKVYDGAGDFRSLVDDLRKGQITDRVKFLVFNELSDVQPVTMLEMPKKYLENPNGRVLYALKSWTLKQLDVARRDVFSEIRKGNVAKGSTNLMRLGSYMALGGVGSSYLQDFVLGKPVSPDDISDRAISNIWKNFGASEYLFGKIGKGDIRSAASDFLVPPMGPIDNVARDILTASRGGEPDFKSLQNVPVVGKLFYFWFGNGLENFNKSQARYGNKG